VNPRNGDKKNEVNKKYRMIQYMRYEMHQNSSYGNQLKVSRKKKRRNFKKMQPLNRMVTIEIHKNISRKNESVVGIDIYTPPKIDLLNVLEADEPGSLETIIITKINIPIQKIHFGMFKLFGIPRWKDKVCVKWTWETDEKYLEKLYFCFPHLDTVGALEIISRAIKLGSEKR